MDRIEVIYDKVLSGVFKLANPIKKSVKRTECKVHISINFHALSTLFTEKYIKEYNFFNTYIDSINKGAVWADQDFRSSNHFYNPIKKRGLFGRKNAMDLTIDYYSKSIDLWPKHPKKSMFYLGAATHIIQDMTVPQHANIRLLDDHHQYENFVKKNYKHSINFDKDLAPYFLDSISDYIRFNSRMALKIYRKFQNVKEEEERFMRVTKCIIPLSIRTTTGLMLLYYKETANL